MALEEYVRKRSFDKTPEPGPGPSQSPANTRFYIQRHDATRLHYDFRLEIDGVLVSWAVPKGPSLDPADKRMAVHVEDHPLEYGNFEGNIPAGNYGAGSVMLWDRGTYDLLDHLPAAAQIARGDLKFRLHGEKLKGAFALVHMKGRGKGNDWLLIKKKDEFAAPGWDIEAHARSVLTGRSQQEIAKDLPARETPAPRRRAAASSMPARIEPMKACPAAAAPAGTDWLYEIKWDGVRAICFIEGGRVRLVSRTGNAMDRQYPELSVLPHRVASQTAILDGEIAALDSQGRPSFALLQNRIAAADANAIAHMARSHPVVLYVFDLLYVNGEDLRSRPLLERKQLLASVLKPDAVVRLSEHFQGDPGQLLEAARENGLEGIIAKRTQSVYESKRSQSWLKVKIVNQQEFVICGYTQGEREHFSSLVLGMFQQGKLVYVGCVGTGFDSKLLKSLAGMLESRVTARRPFSSDPKIGRPAVWVRPELVCEVRFANWTEDGRLRAPVYLGLRPDAEPQDAVKEIAQRPDSPEAETTALLPPGKDQVTVTVEGRRLKFTNLNKIWFPRDGYTKRDLIGYYDAVGPLINPYLEDRPLSLKRYPNGIESEFFFQKNTPEGYPSWLRVEPVYSEHNRGPIHYIVGGDRATLLYLVNLGCIDHNPTMSRIGSLENPDFVLIDLDPQEADFGLVVEAALLVRKKLDRMGLAGYPKTTGGDGLHVYIPVEPVYTYDQTRAFAEVLARLLADERPDLFTTPRPVARREKGKVYFDYLQNGESKTIAAPYVARAYPGAPVATPLEWREVTPSLTPGQFHIRNAPERFARRGDLFRGVLENPQRLEPAIQKLEKLARG